MVFMPHAQQVQLKISFYIDVAILYVFFCANIRLTLRRKSPQRKKSYKILYFCILWTCSIDGKETST